MNVDLTAAQRFLTLLDEEAACFTFQTFHDAESGAPKQKELSRVLHGSLEECAKTLISLNQRGAGCYVMINPGDGRGRGNDNVVGVRALFADFDGSPLPESWPIEPHILIESSPKKYHVYWLASGIDPGEFKDMQETLARSLGSDPSVKDKCRVMRLPGFFHRKHAPFRTHIIEERPAMPYERGELVRAFRLDKINDSEHQSAKPESSSVADWLVNVAQGNALHDSLRDLAAHLAAKALRFEEICALLETAMNASAAPRDERWRARYGEIPGLVNSAIQKFRGTAPGPDSAPEEWPEPIDFLRRPAAFPLAAEDSVPAISDYAMLFARAGGFCPSATILAGLAVCAAAIDDGVRLRLPVSSSWFESARLWVVPIGPPASGKTPALRAMASPLMELHRELFEQWRRACKEAEEQKEPKPKQPALYSSDATTEALADLLHSNPRGLLYACDEFESWIGSHDCYRGNGASRDRGEWLALYDGGPHQVNRVTRGSFFVPNWGCSILSATTPGALKKLASKLPTDGLMQRFLTVLVDPMTKPDTSILHLEMKEARDRYEGTVRRLYALQPAIVQLGREARELFESELDRLRDATEAVEAVSESLSAHIAKHAAMLARVALAYHCIVADDHRADVEAGPVRAAANLMRKLGRHAMAVYFDLISATAAPAVLIARDVARLLIAHTPECVRRRDLIQNVRAFRSASLPSQDAAMQYLRDCAWIEPLAGTYDKGYSTMWTVNPKLAGKFAAQGAAERKRRAAVRDMIHDAADVRSALKC